MWQEQSESGIRTLVVLSRRISFTLIRHCRLIKELYNRYDFLSESGYLKRETEY